MTNRAASLGQPRDHLRGAFPAGTLKGGAPTAAAYAKAIATALTDAIGDSPVADVAEAANLHRSTIYSLVSGTRWPDVASIAQLEEALKVTLWPELHTVADRPR